MSNRRKSTGGFTTAYTLTKERTALALLAYLWQQQKINDDQLRQLANGEEVEVRLTNAQATEYPVVAYQSKTGKGRIVSEDTLQEMLDTNLVDRDNFTRVAVWNDEDGTPLTKDATEEFFDSISHVEGIFADPTPSAPQPDAPAPIPAKDLDTQVLEFLEGLTPDQRNAWLTKVTAVIQAMNDQPSTGNAMDDWLKAHAKK